ncbi:MAG: hypothetical protein E7599_05075 [Ruminococcaceae bacterium]|nr:hypothetical protein [Oscillospiraceae bacterium]
MGFGLIALGWMFFADIPWEVDLLADFFGCFLIVMGCKRLRPYSGYFGAAATWFSLLIVPSVAITALQIAQMITDKKWLSEYIVHADMVQTLVFAVALYYLLLALIRISTDVGREKIARKCRRNIAIAAVTILFYVATNIADLFSNHEYVVRAGFVGYALWYVMLALQFVQIFSCYMWICYEGDEDMPMKETSYKTNPYARFEKRKADRQAAGDAEGSAKKKKKKK